MIRSSTTCFRRFVHVRSTKNERNGVTAFGVVYVGLALHQKRIFAGALRQVRSCGEMECRAARSESLDSWHRIMIQWKKTLIQAPDRQSIRLAELRHNNEHEPLCNQYSVRIHCT